MAVNYTLTVSDPTGALGSNASLLAKDIDFVMAYLGQYIFFQKPLDLQIVVKPSSDNPFHTDGLLPSIPAWVTSGGQATLAALVKGQTGVDPNGAVPDAGFTIYLGNDGTVKNYGASVWFDPNPQLGAIPVVPTGNHDFISIAIHEIIHCLGFASWPEMNAPWNQHTVLQGSVWYYSSAAIDKILGGRLPLDPLEIPGKAGDHIGNTSLSYQPVTSDLMYEFGNYEKNCWDIGQVDLLILKDLGWTVQNYESLPLVDPLDQFNLVGTAGNDTIQANKSSSVITALAGNDVVVLPNGTSNGNYLIDGGPGVDTLQLAPLSSQFNIVTYGGDFLLQSKDGSAGVSLLHSIESIKFGDKTITLSAPVDVIAATTIQNDYAGIARLALPLDQAMSVVNAINGGTLSEIQYVSSLLTQVANTSIPAVAVESSMYGAVGTSTEVTLLAAQFLPPQVANALSHGFNPQVYASEALGLVFAFNNENGSTAFANNFGPSHAGTPNTVAGDAAFAAAASTAIFGTASTVILVNAIQGYVANWKAFYTGNGIPGFAQPTADQVDLAARGAAWGDAVGLALANNLGPLPGQVTNFLQDAAQGTALYSASLASQPAHKPFQGEVAGLPPPPAGGLLGDVTVSMIGVGLDSAFNVM